ncbi:MAG: type II toxin-antitoxin system prevent-host-death family antitoxin [Candidatus Hydrogenedentes bacterium]|nr:type II toxin-antitoxin system prevent-host-death family antitoxin [Candidatus Hydrogenedentota bacterium]
MKATILDMRRNPKKILDAIARNETVTLTNRGKSVARIEPIRDTKKRPSIKDLEFFGMWADRDDISDPVAHVRALRKGRFDDL